jgi:cell division septum initiation protein DivIVA
MPEHSEASSEHAIIQEITAPLATLPDDAVPAVAEVDFPVVLRGYDRIAVDAYVKRTSQLVAELQATRSPEAAVRRALERVGGEVSGILQRAHETAESITAKSRTEADDRLEVARQEAAALTAAAERRVKDLDAETDRIWAERHRIVEDARLLARQLLALAESAVERFPPEEPAPPAPPVPPVLDPEAPGAPSGLEAEEAEQAGLAPDEATEATAAFPAPVPAFGADELGVAPPPAPEDEDEAPTRIFEAPPAEDELGAPWGFEHGPEAPEEP